MPLPLRLYLYVGIRPKSLCTIYYCNDEAYFETIDSDGRFKCMDCSPPGRAKLPNHEACGRMEGLELRSYYNRYVSDSKPGIV